MTRIFKSENISIYKINREFEIARDKLWGIARSHTEPNQANMVVVERYALIFGKMVTKNEYSVRRRIIVMQKTERCP